MKIAYLIKKPALLDSREIYDTLGNLQDLGIEVYNIAKGLQENTGMLIAFGGDGTLLSAACYAAPVGIPVFGVNFGRMGFLSCYRMEDLVPAIESGDFCIEERELLNITCEGLPADFWPYALNEVSLCRSGVKMLGIDVNIDGQAMPTYWADGLLVSTGSGSTAYNLSAGGPICMPQVKDFIITPLAPHNLNVRPLVVPDSVTIELKAESRRLENVCLTADNQSVMIPSGKEIRLSKAPFALKMVKLKNTNFIEALKDKLSWGEDVRNSLER